MNAAEAGQACAAQNVSEHGFGLIVGGVGDGDFRDVIGGNEPIEKGVTGAARGVFEVGLVALCVRCDVRATAVKWQVVLRGECGDEFFVGVGSAATQLMIEMGDADDDAELRAQFQQQMQQALRNQRLRKLRRLRDRLGGKIPAHGYVAIAGLKVWSAT